MSRTLFLLARFSRTRTFSVYLSHPDAHKNTDMYPRSLALSISVAPSLYLFLSYSLALSISFYRALSFFSGLLRSLTLLLPRTLSLACYCNTAPRTALCTTLHTTAHLCATLHRSRLHCTRTARYTTLHTTALQRVAVCVCSACALRYTLHFTQLHTRTATHALQHTATHYITLQHTARH